MTKIIRELSYETLTAILRAYPTNAIKPTSSRKLCPEKGDRFFMLTDKAFANPARQPGLYLYILRPFLRDVAMVERAHWSVSTITEEFAEVGSVDNTASDLPWTPNKPEKITLVEYDHLRQTLCGHWTGDEGLFIQAASVPAELVFSDVMAEHFTALRQAMVSVGLFVSETELA